VGRRYTFGFQRLQYCLGEHGGKLSLESGRLDQLLYWPWPWCDDGFSGWKPARQVASAETDGVREITPRQQWYEYYRQDPAGALEQLRELLPDPDRETYTTASQPAWPLLTLLEALIRNQQYSEAEALGLLILASDRSDTVRWPAARRLFHMYVIDVNDGQGAAQMYGHLENFDDPGVKDGTYEYLMELFLGEEGLAGRGGDPQQLSAGAYGQPGLSNYPNPFNPVSVVSFTLPEQTEVRIEVFNIAGQRVATLVNETLTAGTHTATFDGSRLASGLYLARMQLGSTVLTHKMMLVK
jgi:hypothetical protein